jgi:excinuclease UvrABC nuclease subunit
MESLRQAMQEAAKELDFEQAARLRDRLHELERWTD